jgi:accessory gene regulator protein AgrB
VGCNWKKKKKKKKKMMMMMMMMMMMVVVHASAERKWVGVTQTVREANSNR